MTRLFPKAALLAAPCLLGIASTAIAQPMISWQTSVQMYDENLGTGHYFVDTTGVGVLAMNGTTGVGAQPGPVNGVTFTNVDVATLTGSGYTENGATITGVVTNDHATAFGDGSFTSDVDIFDVLRSAIWNPGTITISGLTDGDDYMLQIFTNDARAGRHSDFQTAFSDGVNDLQTSFNGGTQGISKLSNRDPLDPLVGEPGGDSIIGTFTADATGTVTFDYDGSNDGWLGGIVPGSSGGRAQINGLQLRNLSATPGSPADLDGDGDVDDADFGIAFAAFTGPNNGPSGNPAADLDQDGDVDDADFGIAFAAFTGPGGAAVPEPTSLALLGLGGLLIARRRRA